MAITAPGPPQGHHVTQRDRLRWQPAAQHSSSWIHTCRWLFAIFVTLVIGSRGVVAFNLAADPSYATTFQVTDDASMFGFTVQQYFHAGNNHNSILVGAPRAQTTQPGVTRGGAVYMCSVTSSSSCRILPFDSNGNSRVGVSETENKTEQWFGATLHALPARNKIVACAPRYVYFDANNPSQYRNMIGKCIIDTTGGSSSGRDEFTPCKQAEKAKEEATCQAGFSASLMSDGAYLGIGAVGAFYQQGQVFAQNILHLGTKSQTKDQGWTQDLSHMGYSMTLGEFNDNPGQQEFVVGVPRNPGSVRIIEKAKMNTKEWLHEIMGDQLGEHFGYSVTVGDFNDDTLDDVAIGAPFHTHYGLGVYNTGKVTVVYQDHNAGLKAKRTELFGRQMPGSCFGLAMSSIGDMNGDGFKDLAVGAPYDGVDGHGAVYIFHGAVDGIRPQVSQIIEASRIGVQLKAFGFSLNGGADQDGNLYPDLVVGSYVSNTVVLLKSRPVITVTMELIPEPATIDLNQKCPAAGVRYSCFSLETCTRYSGKTTPFNITLRMEWKLDATTLSAQRVFFKDSAATTWRKDSVFEKGRRFCSKQKVFVHNNVRDKRTPISIEVKHQLLESPRGAQLQPILDQYTPTTSVAQVKIQQYCGGDNKCVPDLILTARLNNTEHVLGSDDEVLVVVNVRNIGEDAHLAQSYMCLPPGVSYIKVAPPDTGVNCQMDSKPGMMPMLTCLLGNPVSKDKEVTFSIHLSADEVDTDVEELAFHIHANSSDEEATANHTIDNEAKFNLTLNTVTKFMLQSKSDPDEVWYNDSMHVSPPVNETHIGPEVTHLYEIQYVGPTTASQVTVRIHWPSSYGKDESPLLYLLRTPRVTQATGTCTAHFVNDRGIKLDTDRKGERRPASIQPELKIRRRRGQPDATEPEVTPSPGEKLPSLECEGGVQGCQMIECVIKDLSRGQSALVEVRSRVWVETINKLKGARPGMHITSQALVHVSEPFNNDLSSQKVTTTVQYAGPSRTGVPIWVYIVSILAGVLILVIIIIVMARCGFFERKKVPADKECYEENIQRKSVRIKSKRGESFRNSQRPDVVRHARPDSGSDTEDLGGAAGEDTQHLRV